MITLAGTPAGGIAVMAQDPLTLVCIEPNFPGRLGAVADWLVRRRGYRVHFYCHNQAPREAWPASAGRGLDVVAFDVGGVAREAAVAWTQCLQRGLCYAYGCYEVLDARRPQPVDLVLGRPAGLGAALFVPATLPRVPTVSFFDYWYHPYDRDLSREPDRPAAVEYTWWRRSAGVMDLLEMEGGAHAWTPTAWQRDLYPPEYRGDFTVLFDGVDAARFRGGPARPHTLAGRTLPAEARVVTFVSRRADRLRGFDRFVTLANRLLRERPDVVCVATGGGNVDRGLDVMSYGKDFARAVLTQTPPADPERFWHLGPVTPDVLAEVLAASDLHVYPSRPYPVSRSLVEAMAAGRVVLAWDAEPVREFVTPGDNGLLVALDDPEAAFLQARAVLADPAAHRALGEAAADGVRQRWDREITGPALASWFDRLAGRGEVP
jgi:glycosyltransferase involved in cell wall biosynthesis